MRLKLLTCGCDDEILTAAVRFAFYSALLSNLHFTQRCCPICISLSAAVRFAFHSALLSASPLRVCPLHLISFASDLDDGDLPQHSTFTLGKAQVCYLLLTTYYLLLAA